MSNFFFIDINTTTRCNLRCKYCIEPFKENFDFPEDKVDLLFKRVEELLTSDFMTVYEGITLGFWGGEPTTNPKTLFRVIENYENNPRVRFLIYSNGYRINHIKDMLLKYKNVKSHGDGPKVYYQISYDGEPAHGLNRKSVDGKSTTNEVRETIIWARDNKIPYSIKSTINHETFKYMDQCYLDIKELVKGDNTYFPTIDYLTNVAYSKEQEKQYYTDLEGALLRIAEHEIEFYKFNKKYFFSWFYKNKALCSAGSHGVAVDIDGKVYKCHGVFYSNKKDENLIVDLQDDDFVEKLSKSCEYHRGFFRKEPEECKNCYATFCLRCNSIKYDLSTKDNFIDKWTDYPNQPEICNLYKLSTTIKKAIDSLLLEEK